MTIIWSPDRYGRQEKEDKVAKGPESAGTKKSKEPKQGFENLNALELVQIFQDAQEIWGQIQESWEEKSYGAVVVNLIKLADKIGQVSPEISPALGAVIESYGAAAKPLFDQLFSTGTKATGYFYEQMAELKKNLLPQMEKYEKAKADIYAMKLRVLQGVDFKRDEAMDIILAEISGAKASKRSLLENFKTNMGGKRKD